MKSARVPSIVLAIAYLAFLASLGVSATVLPDQVASHFNSQGKPDSWTSRTTYLVSMGAVSIALTVFILAIGRFIYRAAPSTINIPNREYWLSPERVVETQNYLFRHLVWFAVLQVGFSGGVNWMIVRSNLSSPIQLIGSGMTSIILGTVGIWIAILLFHFRKPN